ncbi:MAG: o-succinylbenzoate--CoA ligase [Nocardioidaceae bacterium]
MSLGSHSVPTTLRPVAGDPAEILALLRRWLASKPAAPLVVRTSGSTGEPKGVLLSQSAIRSSALATLARIGGPGHWVLALPAHYVAGLQVIVRSVLAGTEPVVLNDYPGLVEAANDLTGDRRYLAVVPTQLHRWLAEPAAVVALRSFDAVLLGGGAAPDRMLVTARQLGIRVVTTYGMSETCGGCVYDGVPLDGVRVDIGPAGDIRLAGPTLFDGYVGQPGLTAAVLRSGWLHTPDIGQLETGGRLRVLGRADDVVISGGVNVPLAAVQERLAAMPGVEDCAVVGVPDPQWGDRVVAVVVAHPPPALADIRDFVAERLPREWAPRHLVAWDALPMLPSGKIDKQLLRRSLKSAS